MIWWHRKAVRRVAWPLLLVLMINMAACGRSIVMQDNHDSMLARQVLVVTLEAWKSKSALTLLERDPPIHFTDDDLGAGVLLVEYQITPQTEDEDADFSIGVELVLQDHRGQTSRKQVRYDVSLDPEIRVTRQEK